MLHRAPMILAALILFQVNASADRRNFTIDTVENADIIGIWSKENAVAANGSVSLEKPEILLKGSLDLLPAKLESSLSSTLAGHFNLLKEKGDRLILFAGISRPEHNTPNGTVYLFRQFAYNHNSDLDEIQLKALRRIIDQVELARKWPKLSAKMKIEHSDIIVSGHIIRDELLGDPYFSIHITRLYRGIYSGQRMEILPVLQEAEKIIPSKLLSFPEIKFNPTKVEPTDAGGTRKTGKGEPTGRIKGRKRCFLSRDITAQARNTF